MNTTNQPAPAVAKTADPHPSTIADRCAQLAFVSRVVRKQD